MMIDYLWNQVLHKYHVLGIAGKVRIHYLCTRYVTRNHIAD